MGTTEQFSLRWNNFHSNLTSGFHELLEASEMVDVTLAVNGQFLQAHKIVLSICSPLFKQMFKVNPCEHPIVILKDVGHDNMRDILEFMYMGEVNVMRENLPSFLRTAELLQVKGLTGDDSSDTSSRKGDKCESLPDDEQEMINDNHLTDSDVELPSSHYQTNRVPNQSHSQISSSSSPSSTITASVAAATAAAVLAAAATCSSSPSSSAPKRLPKNSPLNVKRAKIDQQLIANKHNEHDNNSKAITSDDNIFNEDVKVEKSQLYDNEDTRENIKNLLKNNNVPGGGPGNTPTLDSNTPEDVLLYSVDQKHVYCPYCCRKFVNRYNLKVHIRDKHEDSPFALDCRICGKVMRNRSCLRVHMYHHRKQQLEQQFEQLEQLEKSKVGVVE